MAIKDTSKFTLLSLAQLPQNKDAKDIINLLAQHNPILMDAPAFECNKGSVHETTVLTGLPKPLWGRIYKGIPTSTGKRQKVKDTTGFLESASEVDARIVDEFEKAEDKASVRFEEAAAHLEAMSQEVASAIFYHDTQVDPEKPLGFAPRFSSLSAENGKQIIDGGGVGNDNTSMWMITWDKMKNHLIYPKSTMAGIQRNDLGKIVVEDENGDRYSAYREEFKQHLGVTCRDWRYVARGANMDVTLLTEDASAGANILNILSEMYYVHNGRRDMAGSTNIYVNTDIVKYLDYQSRNVPKNLQLMWSQTGVNASEVLMYRGISIRECDALLSTEATIV